jgi:hypothetical protein
MSPDVAWPWAGVLLLGAAHGVNPGMGWLFAVALGLQERRQRAVWRALIPLAFGHAAAIGAVALVAVAVGATLPPGALRWFLGALLVAFGAHRLTRGTHPRYGGMRVGTVDLTVWSFLMATAHGAGLMVLPLLLVLTGRSGAGGAAEASGDAHAHGAIVAGGADPDHLTALLATGLHSVGYLLVTAVIAMVVYQWAGLRLLRSAWLNLDRIWALALIGTGVLTPLL